MIVEGNSFFGFFVENYFLGNNLVKPMIFGNVIL